MRTQCLIGTVVLAVMTPLAAVGADTFVVRPALDNSLLVNPGKGYVQYYGTDDKYTKDYIGVIYTRWAWSVLEPKEGEYHWDAIDQFIAQAGKYGKKDRHCRHERQHWSGAVCHAEMGLRRRGKIDGSARPLFAHGHATHSRELGRPRVSRENAGVHRGVWKTV